MIYGIIKLQILFIDTFDTRKGGEEMGPLVLDILLGIDQEKARQKDLKNGKRPLLDAELEDKNDTVWKDLNSFR